MIEKLNSLRESTLDTLMSLTDLKALNDLRIRVLGRKGELTGLLRSLKDFSPEERSRIGKLANEIKEYLEKRLDDREQQFVEDKEQQELEKDIIDVTLPGRRVELGQLHVLNQVTNELIEVFTGLGFQLAEGPEVELDYYNFEALNIPRDHPARDMQDTFYFSDNVVLRTHTSPVQIRTMEKTRPPVRVICPGKVYRRDADITHSPMFMQIEGLWVDEIGRAHV